MSNRQKEIIGLVLITFSILSIISLFGHDITENPMGLPDNYIPANYLGLFGVYISHYHYQILGYTSIIFPIIFTYLGYILLAKKEIKSSLKLIIFTLSIGWFLSTLMGFIAHITANDDLVNYFSGSIGWFSSEFLMIFLGS